MNLTPVIVILIILVVVLPVMWLFSEFGGNRKVRITLGIASILASFGVATIVGLFERLNSNAWFGYASKDLIDATVSELEAGNSDRVLQALHQLQAEYSPTYENRAHYDVLVEQTIAEMKSK